MFFKRLFICIIVASSSLGYSQTITQVAYTSNRHYTGFQVNDSGTVIGNYITTTSNISKGWVWSAGAFIPFNIPTGYTSGVANAINSAGKISGNIFSSPNSYPAFWNLSGGSYSGAGVSTTQISAKARAVNSAGEAVGDAGTVSYMFFQSAIPTDPHVFSIPPWPGNTSASAYDINNSSTVLAGSSGGTGGTHRYITFKGGSTPYYTTRTQIPNAIPSTSYTVNGLSAINNFNVVLGKAQDSSNHYYGFTWTAGSGFTMLATPNGGNMTPYDINDSGDIVGSYGTSSGNRPFAILGGVFYDLSSYFTSVPRLEVNEAVSINANRQIVVNGSISFIGGGGSLGCVYLLDLP